MNNIAASREEGFDDLVENNRESHRVDPFTYLKDILERLPAHPADRLGELLPDAWSAANPDERRRVAS